MSINKHNTPFNVLRHKNIHEVAPKDPVTAITTFIVGASASAVTYYTVYALTYIALTMVTSALITALTPKPDQNPNNSNGLQVNSKNALAPMQFVYGKARKGGTITFQEVTGGNNKILHQIISLAGHEIDSVEDVYFNDSIIQMSNGGVTSAIWDNKIKVYIHDGSQTSATDAFANSTETLATTLHAETTVTSDFIGKGIAYIYCRFEFDSTVFSNGVPQVTAVVKGKKVVTTINGVAQTPTWTDNAAWIIRDFITSDYGLEDSSIDYATFEEAASVSEDTTVLSDSSKQYTINGIVQASQNSGTVLQEMMTSCGGTLFWGAGAWRLFAGAFVAPTKILTLDDLRSGISLDTKMSMANNFNAVRGTFIDRDEGYISADYPQINSSAFLAEDNGIESILDLALPYTTNPIAAQRLAKQMLFRNREQLTLNAEFGLNALNIEVGDFVKFGNDRYGWTTGNEKTFEVTNWKLSPNVEEGDLRVSMTLRESSSSAYGFNESDEQDIINNNTSLLPYYDVPQIGVTVTKEYREVNESVVNVLVIEATSSAIERVESVIVKYKKTSDTVFKSVGQAILVNEGNTAGRFEVVGIDAPQINQPPINYTISVTPVNSLGYKGTTITTTFNVAHDTTPPSAPTNLTHLLSGGTAFFNWSPVTALDLSHYKLYYSSNSSANFGDASTLIKVEKIARPATSVSFPALAGKFFVSSVDKTGNESTTAVSSVIAGSELPELGASDTDTENPNFSGSKTNLTVSGGNLFMTSFANANSTGAYDFNHDGNSYFDVGTSRTVRLSYAITVARKHQDAVNGEVNWDDIPNNWDTWPNNFDTWTDEDAEFSDYAVVIEARAADTVSNLASASFVDASGEIVGRFVEFRATLSNTGPKITPNISALSATVEY
tara:strand:- start:12168 stop:14843 length:2676 start_codon:yes stop_codon:yes gene_type:complete